jgi:hypothetical protein
VLNDEFEASELVQNGTLKFSHDPQESSKELVKAEFGILRSSLLKPSNLTPKGATVVAQHGVDVLFDRMALGTVDEFTNTKALTREWNMLYLGAVIEFPGKSKAPEIVVGESKCLTSLMSLKTIFHMRKGVEKLAHNHAAGGDTRKRLLTGVPSQHQSTSTSSSRVVPQLVSVFAAAAAAAAVSEINDVEEPPLKAQRVVGANVLSVCPVLTCGMKFHRGDNMACEFYKFVKLDEERREAGHAERHLAVSKRGKESLPMARRRVFKGLRSDLCV